MRANPDDRRASARDAGPSGGKQDWTDCLDDWPDNEDCLCRDELTWTMYTCSPSSLARDRAKRDAQRRLMAAIAIDNRRPLDAAGLRDLCGGRCVSVDDPEVRSYCGGECHSIPDADIRNACHEWCTQIQSPFLADYCRAALDPPNSHAYCSAAYGDYRHLCTGDCYLIWDRDLRAFCQNDCAAIGTVPAAQWPPRPPDPPECARGTECGGPANNQCPSGYLCHYEDRLGCQHAYGRCIQRLNPSE